VVGSTALDGGSPRESVAHLVLNERDWSWVDRIKVILDPTFRPDNEDEVTEEQVLAEQTIPELLDEFAKLRSDCIRQLVALNLTEDDLQKLNEKGTCSIAQLLATWVAHDLYHLGQIFKSFAAPLQSKIGPYQAYLNLPHFN
jgi:uncharacterized damage-inducible protein DinB